MFERFTQRARQVVVLAQEEARLLNHNYIGTEHLLLGLLREEEGIAARVLESQGVAVDEVRAQVAAIVGEGDAPTTGQIPFTPRAKRVLELALREALTLSHSYIGTEHVLLGLTRVDDGVAARILLDLDADSETIRNAVLELLSGQQPAPRLRRTRRQPRWAYRVEPLGALETAGELEAFGAEGWELVTVVGEPGALRGIFKRPA